ncbi:hypothetical protein [Burkholderia vietnamiensis]|uniref:hypothetical protein n=1 Tax=Burkholderia vietnamiensis TaxID=60552 RepID=UPI00159314B8|nr:hypothetical protein [Burkholderia vietnamiensis]MCA8270715.1 hypothetical protein [Burkholderia vietnamiensis]
MNVAAAAEWAHKKDVVILVNPAKRKKIGRTLVGAILVAAFGLVVTGHNGPVDQWAKRQENARMRPAMEQAMASGSPEAATWLAVHFRTDYPGLLEQQAAKGEPTAMYLIGSMEADKGNRAKGLSMIHAAAMRGNELAIKYESDHRS